MRWSHCYGLWLELTVRPDCDYSVLLTSHHTDTAWLGCLVCWWCGAVASLLVVTTVDRERGNWFRKELIAITITFV